MASKDRREKRNFDRAFSAREQVIEQLTQCGSYARLQEITSKLNKSQSKSHSPYSISNLTEYHTATIKNMDQKIADLIDVKSKQFPKPVATTEPDATSIVPTIPAEKKSVTVVHTTNEPVKAPVPRVFVQTPGTPTTPYKPLKRESNNYNSVREHELAQVMKQLARMLTKIDDLYLLGDECEDTAKADIYHKAARAASSIYNSVSLAANDYIYEAIDLDVFKEKTQEFLNDDARNVQTLKTHRGWKEVLLNLLIAVTGVGFVALAAASVYNGRITLFTPSTDSGKKVDALRESVEQVQETVALK